ncbi:M48 family metallopeptidase [Komagataeibacter sp. FNDCR2]|uniref:tetratricopeptide repeat protein n=1 Tax=Komagataeibacter sp. FNDCR2 TaxID=2878682 RepID=UPI001E5259F4|nr:hypothetical protein [Komagataeibacter sp. FNDCR2]MCE2576133.1 hypothetical protein [Komagataeibacter sp. FNDCR2]
MIETSAEPDVINFGPLPAPINALLQQGVLAYRDDYARADALFRQALQAAPDQLPVYFCLYKIHTYRGNLEDAQAVAESGLREAARQAGWNADWRQWCPEPDMPDGPGRFALYTLKALAFINLRQNLHDEAQRKLDALKILDPSGAVGWRVIDALAEGVVPEGTVRNPSAPTPGRVN